VLSEWYNLPLIWLNHHRTPIQLYSPHTIVVLGFQFHFLCIGASAFLTLGLTPNFYFLKKSLIILDDRKLKFSYSYSALQP
jgi:hypothetical protein